MPSQPHTGSHSWVHRPSAGTHTPPRSADSQRPGGSTQRSPSGQGMPAIVPHSASHTPSCATLAPAAAASQSFDQVRPSQSQTGSQTSGHAAGRRRQAPLPEQAPSGFAQKDPGWQSAFSAHSQP